ncbi:MAG TPA: hydrogenase maturation protease [Chloroflexus aurantiacus]|uniref:Hydrogenase maturation protease n=1 Tax=Chloroflexus aurantiacus (strain ATCC 29366 / DSM 635 / J-10-fl) TaxID=324602 RepID=A9WK94_CHLAA|nr:hydrogenase maturation protease [Chloroflexus aurantiacus]ABY35972.1 hydrogenase maturation protease [Chloroflexus aurantiacus J-10-fl]RMG49397.1 MAG: hydrogenase maturation protease [Chloroflexota bacterium]GIV91515.1 MAG: hydrogenase maturation protease [Chloroflexus sp.]HBW67525.1 hydrogenase maturation protease [Chloroflexus aurantiacus]
MAEQLLIIGCGNLLRGDDAVGPVLVRRVLELGLPPGVGVADAGTSGMDVAFRMRGVETIILVDAARTGADPGTIYYVPGSVVEHLPPLSGINLHAFRWDHALAFGRWLLKDEYPRSVQVYLIEGADFTIGAPLSPAVAARMEDLARHLSHNPWQPYPGHAIDEQHNGDLAA